LRTGSSLPVAPHPASRRRNNSSLQAGERMPEEDLHLSNHVHFQAHYAAPLALEAYSCLADILDRLACTTDDLSW
ncbi:MAG TPA: hypothetical protein VGN16_18290, partial [Acidobacteriaceae bacterium]